MSAVAAIDIGSNSVRLLVVDGAGKTLLQQLNITRLAQGVDADGLLAEDAMQRTITVLARYGEQLRQLGATKVRIGATSAARDARNCNEFFQRVQLATGILPELLSGQAEAALSFAGATAGRRQAEGTTVVFDIGGGSTEFAVGTSTPIHNVSHSVSLNMGCVRICERFLHNDPPTPEQLSDARNSITEMLKRVDQELPCRTATVWLGLAGTVTSLAALDAGLTQYDPTITHDYCLRRDSVDAMHQKLCQLNESERGRLLLNPKRAGVVVGGTMILQTLLHFFDLKSIIVSEHDILDGLAASLLAPA